MNQLTAIDVLLDPDDSAIERAKVVNAQMLESMPQGWALDDTHIPHITTLQRYVRTAELDSVCDAVEAVVAEINPASLAYRAVSITHADWGFPGYGPAVLLVDVNAAVLDFQAKLVVAIQPFTESGGTAAAFVTDADEPDISQTIVDWVERFVPAQIGDGNYLPHLTVGVATFDDLKVIEAHSFEAFPVRPVSVAVYHLGNNGTARELLKEWPLSH
jgi:hypothetical protein